MHGQPKQRALYVRHSGRQCMGERSARVCVAADARHAKRTGRKRDGTSLMRWFLVKSRHSHIGAHGPSHAASPFTRYLRSLNARPRNYVSTFANAYSFGIGFAVGSGKSKREIILFSVFHIFFPSSFLASHPAG